MKFLILILIFKWTTACLNDITAANDPFTLITSNEECFEFINSEEALLFFGSSEKSTMIKGISSGNTGWKRVLPTRIMDNKLKMVYFDVPEFAKKRKLAGIIATSYFLNQILNKLNRVKIVMMIKYRGLKDEFTYMFNNITKMMTTLDYENSMCLLVMKEEKFNGSASKKVMPNKEILKDISNSLYSMIKSSGSSKQRLIKKLIGQDGKMYKKILLFTKDDDMKKIIGDIEKNIDFAQVQQTANASPDIEERDEGVGNWSKVFDEMFTSHLYSGFELIFDYYESKANNFTDISDLKNYFNTEKATLTNLINIITKKKTDVLMKPFADYIDMFASYKDDRILTLSRENKYANFLRYLSYNKSAWSYPFINLRKKINDLDLWHNFVVKLHLGMSNYTISKAVADATKRHLDISNANSVINWLQRKMFMGQDFLKMIKKLKKDSKMDETMVKIIKPVFPDQVSITCGKDQLTVKGRYVFMSYIPKCPALRLVILCADVLFLDKNYIRTEDDFNMYVIASKWVVIGDRKIKLGGVEGYSQKNRAAYKAYAKPGGPGGAGGYFNGIVIRPADLSHLTVDVSGGKGGKGQAGYTGANITISKCDVQTVDWSRMKCPKTPLFKNCSISYLKTAIKIVSGEEFTLKIYNVTDTAKNMKGGPGGPYGDGGLGGFPGNFLMNYLENGTIPLTVKAFEGLQGAHGNCGKGGEGLRSIAYSVGTYCYNEFTYYIPRKLNGIKGEPGDSSCLLNKHDPPAKPKPARITTNETIIPYVKEFREYLLSVLKDTFDQRNLIENYLRLSKIPHMSPQYNIQNILDEFKTLEKYTTKSTPFSLLYVDLLSRLEKYTLYNKLDTSTRAYITFVYTMISTVVTRIRSATSGVLLAHINEYLYLIKENIKHINEIEGTVMKQKEIDTFTILIDAKIEDVGDLVKNFLLPSIQVVLRNVSLEVDKTAGDILNVTNKSADMKLLRDKQNKLQNSVVFGLIAGVFKAFSSFLSFVPVYGKVIGVASSGAEVITGSSMSIKDIGKPPNLTQAKMNREHCQQVLDDIVQSRINGCLQYFQALEELFKKQPVAQLKPELERLKGKAFEIAHETKLWNSLEEFHAQIKSFVTKMKKGMKSSNFSNATDNAEKISSLTIIIGSLGEKIIGNLSRVELVKKEIEKIGGKQIKDMYRYVTGVFRDVVNDVGDGLKNATKQAKHKFTLAEMKNMMIDLKDMIFGVTSKLPVQNNINDIVYQFNDAMDTIINLFSTIDNYKDQKEMVRLTYSIAKTKISSTFSKEAARKKQVYDLANQITVNRILQQYETAIYSFQQFYFPFAFYFLTEFEQPKNLASSNVSEVIAKTLVDIGKISMQFHDKYYIVHQEVDGDTHQAVFRRHPFFIWDNDHYGAQIARFLQGEEIVLYADVRWQPKNAVKFNAIDLEFVLTNKNESASNVTSALGNIESFYIQMIHSGNCYYRCAKRYYKLSVESQMFQFSYTKDQFGEPLVKNYIYNKLETDFYILSPYTLWRLQLIDDSVVGFQGLAPLIGHLDINLVGRGQYVKIDSEVCRKNLSSFYREERLE